MTEPPAPPRDILFISKATPLDDEFALWLAPRLEAAGYKVFCDIVTLNPGDRWRTEITTTLQDRAIKMLLICKDETLDKPGVLEEIEIASDLVKTLHDPKFIIPLRMEKFKKLFGIGGLQYANFEPGWAQGLAKLQDTLKRYKVPRSTLITINPNWENYRRRGAIPLLKEPERLTSNWLRMRDAPDYIFYYEPIGACDLHSLEAKTATAPFPVDMRSKGILTFASLEEVDDAFVAVARFAVKQRIPLTDFLQEGAATLGLQQRDASNILVSMFRQAWITFAVNRGLLRYEYSHATGFHVGSDLAKIGQRIAFGRQGERRWAMLRNIAKGVVWQYGVTAMPAFWPFPHFKLKSRVLFAPPEREDAGEVFDDKKKQHRLRRSVCKGWRNRQWHGRLLAFLELLSGDASSFRLPLSPTAYVTIEAAPLLFTSPVSTPLPTDQTADDEESDDTTLGKPEPEGDEE